VADERLHEEFVAEDAAIDDLVPLVRRHDVLAELGAAARVDLGLRDDELRRLDVELLRRRLGRSSRTRTMTPTAAISIDAADDAGSATATNSVLAAPARRFLQ
jgi:hypothetical protein